MFVLISARMMDRALAFAACAILVMPHAAAQQLKQSKPADPSAVKRPVVRQPKALVISPAQTPVPALKYRLVPSSTELNPGDAAPLYLRIRYFDGNKDLEAAWNLMPEKYNWLDLPAQEFPNAEARKLVNIWKKQLEQIKFGTRRRVCDWNYTLPEQRRDSISLDLSDAQNMRTWARLLALKARTEIRDTKFDQAIETIETGLTFGRHIGQGPFLINALVGMAISNMMLESAGIDQLISEPGAPNLYWALTALPRPMIGLRHALEMERQLCENLIPELAEAELSRPRDRHEWALYLARMHQGIVDGSRKLFPGQDSMEWNPLKILGGADLAAFKANVLPVARQFLRETMNRSDAELAAMSDDEVIARYMSGGYHEFWDNQFKLAYLPVREAIPRLHALDEGWIAVKHSPLSMFAQLLPAIQASLMAEVRLDAKIAALRTVEALRIYAANHKGALPESLSQVTEVPIPDNPITGRPFQYELKGGTASLSGIGPILSLQLGAPAYTITIRK